MAEASDPFQVNNTLSGSTTRSSIVSYGAWGLLSAFTIMLSIYALVLWSNETKDTAADWVVHTLRVENKLNQVLITLVDAETGQRGYLLTGDENYLEPFTTAFPQISVMIEQLEILTQDNSVQKNLMKKLSPVISKKLEELHLTITLKRQEREAEALVVVNSGNGKKAMDHIRNLIERMIIEEEKLLEHRRDEQDVLRRLTVYGQIVLFLVLIITITFVYRRMNELLRQQKIAEEVVYLSEKRHTLLVQTQSDLITRFTPEGILNFVNDAYVKFSGKEASELIGASIYWDVPIEQHDIIKANFSKLRLDAPSFTTENHNEDCNGNVRAFEWINHAYFDEEGNVTEIQSVGRDLTEIHLARNLAQSANKAKSDFLSTMSHEIRTPLNGVLGLAELLKDTDLDEDQQQTVDTILSSGQTLLFILNDVLDMSKIEAGALELEDEAFSLDDLFETITAPFESLADDKGLKLTVSSKIEKGMVVKGDLVRFRQVLWNLLSNAIKFTKEGNVILTIDAVCDGSAIEGAASDAKEQMLYITVEDTGAGIAADRVDAVFDVFTQEDNSITRKHGGTGLGLSIVTRLIEMMGGKISVESELGKGTKFSVHVPLIAASKEEKKAVLARAINMTIEKIEPLNVLLAEDNSINALIAKSFLEKFGHTVKHVENGLLAVEAMEQDWADLILMDIHMPEMDGIDATRAIRARENGKTIPIVGLTAEAFTERHSVFKEAGMNDVLTKPFTELQLATALGANGMVARRHHKREAAKAS